MILERSGQDLAGAGRALVDEQHERQVGEQSLLGNRLGDLRLGSGARRHDRTAGDEPVGDLDRRVEDTARVHAQVDDETSQPALLQPGDGEIELLGRTVAEGEDRHVADALLRIDHPNVAHRGVDHLFRLDDEPPLGSVEALDQ